MKTTTIIIIALICSWTRSYAQELKMGTPIKEMNNHLPYIYNVAKDGSFSVLHLSKIKTSGSQILNDRNNSIGQGNAAALGLLNFTTDKSLAEWPNYEKEYGDYYIEHYDEKAKLISKRQLNVKYKNGHLRLKGVYKTAGQSRILATFYNGKKKQTVLYAATLNDSDQIDFKTFEPIDSTKYPFSVTTAENSYTVKLSEDGSKVFVLVWGLRSLKEYSNFFRVKVFDANTMELLHTQELFSEVPNGTVIVDFKVTKDGIAYFLLKQFLTNEDIKAESTQVQTYKFLLLCLNKELKENLKEVSLPSQFISSIALDLKEDEGVCVIAGFYSKIKNNAQDGYFLRTYKIGGLSEEQTLSQQFSEEFKATFIGSKNNFLNLTAEQETEQVALDEQELRHFKIRLMLKGEGSKMIIVAEKYFIEMAPKMSVESGLGLAGGMSMGSSSLKGEADYAFVYLDIMVFEIDLVSGDLGWFKRIPKYQQSIADGGFYNGFFFGNWGDKMFFVYNNREEKKNPNSGLKDATIHIATMTFNGELETINVPDEEEKPVGSISSRIVKILPDGRWIIYTGSKQLLGNGGTGFGTYRFGYLSVD